MNRNSPESGTDSPRTWEASPPSLLGSKESDRVTDTQPNEGIGGSGEESDPSIVLGDGNAVHMGKGAGGNASRAENQCGQSTDTRGRNVPIQSVSSTLTALSHKAAKDPEHRFRSLERLIDLQMLYASFRKLKRKAAPGVDGVTVDEYEENLDENLRDLERRLKEKRYRARPVRRRYIEKAGSRKRRPLGIPSLEDKIVQQAASWILQSIYEEDFSERSVGYRRNVPGPRKCSYQLSRELNSGVHRWVVEADIRSFFEDVDHDWLLRMLKQRIDDRSFLRLIRKWLKAGVLDAEAGNQWEESVSGTPQGGIISPILANLYLHYVLDLWLEKRVRKKLKGKMLWMRFADDFILCFERKDDAENVLAWLGPRLGEFSLSLAEEKSGLVKFNRWEPDDSGKFTFLGFDFYWARTRRNPNHKMVKRRTSKKKLRAALAGMKAWIWSNRSRPLDWIVEKLRAKLEGHWNYYGVLGNSSALVSYEREVKGLIFKWLNRRSQRKSFTWDVFKDRWKQVWQLPSARVVEEVDPMYQPRLAM